MKTAILHYSVPPVVGGVEAVILAHARLIVQEGYPVTLLAGEGDSNSLPDGAGFTCIPEMSSRHPRVAQVSQALEAGQIPDDFEALAASLEQALSPILKQMDNVIIHNVLTKHFNLPLTAALFRLLDRGRINNCVAWCHDFSWSSPHSRPKVHPGFPWELLRTYRQDVRYVTVSQSRQRELAGLFNCDPDQIHVVYDGIDPAELYSLSKAGELLAEQFRLDQADLILLMPVRITQAKNIELALQVIASLRDSGIHPRLIVTGPPDPHDLENLAYYRELLELREQLKVKQEACFVFEAVPEPGSGYTIDLPLVRELYRLSDILFMPSHREGFGMPILEAGMLGMPIFTSNIPAAEEIGKAEVIRISADAPADEIARKMIAWVGSNPVLALRRRIRQSYTWRAIFEHDILPLLSGRERS